LVTVSVVVTSTAVPEREAVEEVVLPSVRVRGPMVR
jgi:hypothetical protein